MNSLRNKKQTLLVGLFTVAFMIFLTFVSVPLYSIFCRTTGYGGTTQRVKQYGSTTLDRYVTVTFDGNVDRNLFWDFSPNQRSRRVKLGEPVTVSYHVHNRSAQTLTGTAVYNVQPDKTGIYFDKVQCFCFSKQTLRSGESADLAVTFYIDPAMARDIQNDDVQNITLSYTFFQYKNSSKLKVAEKFLGTNAVDVKRP